MSEMTAAQSERMFTVAEVEQILDKRFARMTEKNEARIRQAYAQAYAEGLEEGQRNSQYTPEGKNEILDRKERILQERERLLKERELQAQAVEELGKRGLPVGLAKYVPCADEESFAQGLEAVDKTFREMLRQEIDKRLAASAAPLSRSGSAADALPSKAVELAEKINDSRKKDAERSRQINEKYL